MRKIFGHRGLPNIYEENTPSMIVPRTASPVGMQLASDQIITKIEDDEEGSS